MGVRVANNLIHWVRFFLRGVAETAGKGRDVFRQILLLRTEVEHAVLSLGKRTPLALDALRLLYRNPVTTAAELERSLAISTPTANALLKKFIGLNILTETTGQQRARVFVFARYLKLFTS